MRLLTASAACLFVGAVSGASSWSFSDATVTASSKSAKSSSTKFSASKKIQEAVSLGPRDSIKLSLTTVDDEGNAKRPHQALLVVGESSGLEVPFALTVKKSGKGTLQFSQKDLPPQLLLAQTPLQARLILASSDSAKGLVTPTFDIALKLDSSTADPSHDKPLRYVRQAEISHTFRGDPRSPPRIVSLAFALALIASVPTLVVAWLFFEANLGHAATAFSRAPVSHAVFFGSVIGMECVFYLYHGGWNLFRTLPVVCLVGVSAFLSGTKALGEVQRRRLAGER
ncbi:oligosaccharyltransferase subunit ribophorin II [Ophiocordyceps camponoti-floridani]|uniref:Oligosaccharyltransferase subunit ribophorin II n=1 Tax=Ophiocordyceps camponoti-floridani TaxID=2030778 RepID=A0A8H4VFA7_9HYPO|nr:oligosaccharyltransferase subunit ribophorin II [Ophiocordyceps camponoti-floridani]